MLPTTVLSLAVALLASGAQAIKVTAPTTSTVQAAGSALQLTWDSVSTDTTSFAIVLVNQVSCRGLYADVEPMDARGIGTVGEGER